MLKEIEGYYSAEIDDWDHHIEFCIIEIRDLIQHLSEVGLANSIMPVAIKTDYYKVLLNRISERLSNLQWQMVQQRSLLNKNGNAVHSNGKLDNSAKKLAVLRTKVHSAIKEYIDVKFGCYFFISFVVKD